MGIINNLPVVPAASIRMWEAKLTDIPEPVVRVFAVSPETIAVQLRVCTGTAGPLGGRGKQRNMIASAELTAEQMFTLRDTIDEAIREKGWAR